MAWSDSQSWTILDLETLLKIGWLSGLPLPLGTRSMGDAKWAEHRPMDYLLHDRKVP
jgi:hypothetical protein